VHVRDDLVEPGRAGKHQVALRQLGKRHASYGVEPRHFRFTAEVKAA
jgi:hypothetical protein